MKRIIIFGSTSAIAKATALRYASQGASFFLVGTSVQKLSAVACELRSGGAALVVERKQDLDDTIKHAALVADVENALGGIDLVLMAHDTLADDAAESVVYTNFVSAASLLTALAAALEPKRAGVIAVIGSVAGDRGHQSNHVYGSAKGALALFAAGLRSRLARSGVHVLIIKSAFVDIPSTFAFKKNLPWASPERAARRIQRAIEKRQDVLHVPIFWRVLLLRIRALPKRLFKRIKQ